VRAKIFIKLVITAGMNKSLCVLGACNLMTSSDNDKTLPDGLFPADDSGTGAGAEVSITEGPGSVIGRYKLLQQIGEGGFGVVYMAEQTEPVVRRVALKIIKLGMDTKQVIARFEAERQALALMDHPNIAKVLDAGATDSGRPYFVMELVRGVPITEYCDKNHLSARERLELFMQVCQAIQHAHQKGIIHRDIKPSNVLVTLHDGKPVPMVIDFGIAKATNQKLTEKTLFTNFASMIGTPAYMSPEQAEMSKLDVDTRSDIYSLGVLLYELLTGTTPFPEKRLRSVAFGEMQRIIVEEEPDRPSTRLSTMEVSQRTTIAKNRSADPAGLNHLFRGDLDWIVMKCLEKDRTRRYETANGLALDIQRHLANETISARPPSNAYRLQKLVRRNKLAVSAAAAVFLALAAGMVATTLQSVRASKAEAAAKAQANRTMLEANRATEAEKLAVEKSKLAEEERAAAEASLYAAHMNLAQTELAAGNVGVAIDLLNQHRPGAGRQDFRGWEWRYLWKLCRSDEEFTLGTHQERVFGVAFSPDGKWLASADANESGDSVGSKVLLWDFQTRKPLLPPLTEDAAGSVVFSPDGRLIAFGTLREGVKVLALSQRTEVMKIPGEPRAFQNQALAFSPNSKLIAVGDAKGALKIFDLETRKEYWSLAGHDAAVTSAAFFPDGSKLVSGSSDGALRVWDVATGKPVGLWQFPQYHIYGLAISPDGKKIAFVNRHGMSIRVIDANSGQDLAAVPEAVAGISTISFSPDSKSFACGANNHSTRIWRSDDARELAVLKGSRDEIHSVAYSPDGQHLVTGAKDGTVKVWSTRPKLEKIDFLPEARDQQAASLSPNGRWMLRVITNRTVRVVEIPSFREVARWLLSDSITNALEFTISSDGTHTACSTASGNVLILNSFTGLPFKTLVVGTSAVQSIKYSRGGSVLAACGKTEVVVWNTDTYSERCRFRQRLNPPGTYSSIDPASDGRRVAVRFGDGRVAIYQDLDRDEPIIWKAHRGYVMGVAFFPDGRIATAGADARLKTWDIKTQKETVIGRALNAFFSTALNSDSTRLASGAGEGLVRIYDPLRGYQLMTVKSETGYLANVRFLDDRNTLVCLGWSGLQVWSAPSWDEIARAEKQDGKE
jgi:WD40 repeat protein/serine/threonine protein kinase